jgi:hypothetical protein
MTDFEKRFAAKERLTPKAGFNVVGVDSFEDDPAHELFLCGHFETREEAEEELAARKEKSPSERYYIYGPDPDNG